MKDFMFGLRCATLSSLMYHRDEQRTRWWPILVFGDAMSFTWFRGIYDPVHYSAEGLLWWRGWGQHRWKIRPGDLILVHGSAHEVVRVDYRALEVVTRCGRHDLYQCCDRADPSLCVFWTPPVTEWMLAHAERRTVRVTYYWSDDCYTIDVVCGDDVIEELYQADDYAWAELCAASVAAIKKYDISRVDVY
jgi:hypothetical protein